MDSAVMDAMHTPDTAVTAEPPSGEAPSARSELRELLQRAQRVAPLSAMKPAARYAGLARHPAMLSDAELVRLVAAEPTEDVLEACARTVVGVGRNGLAPKLASKGVASCPVIPLLGGHTLAAMAISASAHAMPRRPVLDTFQKWLALAAALHPSTDLDLDRLGLDKGFRPTGIEQWIRDAQGNITHAVRIRREIGSGSDGFKDGVFERLSLELERIHPEHGYQLVAYAWMPASLPTPLPKMRGGKRPGTVLHVRLMTARPAIEIPQGVALFLHFLRHTELAGTERLLSNPLKQGMGRRMEYFLRGGAELLIEQQLELRAQLAEKAGQCLELEAAARQGREAERRIEQLQARLGVQVATIERRDAEVRELQAALRAKPDTIERDDGPLRQALARADDLELQLAGSRLTATQLRETIDAQRQQILELQQQLNGLIAPAKAESGAQQEGPSYPASLEDIDAWAKTALADGRIVLHPKAIAAAKASSFQEPELVYRSLEALRDYYWPMRFAPAEGSRALWKEALAELRLECSNTGTATTDHRTAPFYQVTHEGRMYTLDLHLKGNSSFDPRLGYRLYFSVDRERQLVIVGALPNHLPNRQSN
jgi:hypothetical protein